MKPFSSKSQTFELVQTIWAVKFLGIWGIFGFYLGPNLGPNKGNFEGALGPNLGT